jgi:FAD-dependent urate hydroxylase
MEVTVFEKADMLGDVGAGLAVWANAVRALRHLGLADEAVAAGSRIQRGQIRTNSGRKLVQYDSGELERVFGEPSIAIHRAALHKLLLSALPEEAVCLDSECVGFQQDNQGVTAFFSDGSVHRADLLVGADGIRSVVRRQLQPRTVLRYAGYTAWRGAVMTQDEAALGLSSESWGRGNRFGILRLDAERIYWFATANNPPGIRNTPEERKALLLKTFQGWHQPVEHLVRSTPAGSILQNDVYDIPPAREWGQGRVTLLGDAIHPTTPNLGQGACMAIESAVLLQRCLAEIPDVSAALRAYENGRRARCAWITRQSWEIGRVGQIENRLGCSARNVFFFLLPDGLFKTMTGRAVGYDVTKVEIK